MYSVFGRWISNDIVCRKSSDHGIRTDGCDVTRDFIDLCLRLLRRQQTKVTLEALVRNGGADESAIIAVCEHAHGDHQSGHIHSPIVLSSDQHAYLSPWNRKTYNFRRRRPVLRSSCETTHDDRQARNTSTTCQGCRCCNATLRCRSQTWGINVFLWELEAREPSRAARFSTVPGHWGRGQGCVFRASGLAFDGVGSASRKASELIKPRDAKCGRHATPFSGFHGRIGIWRLQWGTPVGVRAPCERDEAHGLGTRVVVACASKGLATSSHIQHKREPLDIFPADKKPTTGDVESDVLQSNHILSTTLMVVSKVGMFGFRIGTR